MTDGDAGGALAVQPLRGQQAAFASNPAFRLAQNAVTRNSVDDVALNQRVVFETDHTFSTLLDDWGVTNQKQTGRCWMFAWPQPAALRGAQDAGRQEFEFSQNYLMFWDKVERANYFFEAIIDSADRDVGDRSIAFLLDEPLSDGGQWNMFINLVRKHGLVPKAFMPETDSSSNSRRMNGVLRSKLREGARRLRDMHAARPWTRCGRRNRTTCKRSIASCASISARRPSGSPGSGATPTAPSIGPKT